MLPQSLLFEEQAQDSFRHRLRQALNTLAARGIYFGGSSWKYPGWVGQIYTEERYLTRGKFSSKKFESTCLEEYAEVFPAVGGDFSFYSFPTQEQWQRLFHAAPTLLFGLKTPEMITVRKWPTHARYGPRGGTENSQFLDAGLMTDAFLSPLAPHRHQVGVVMLEFGTLAKSVYAAPEAFVEDLDHFLAALPPAFRYAVEVRNPEYLCDTYFQCLRAHRVAHVFNAWTRMPTIAEQAARADAFTADFVVARALLRRGRAYEQAVRSFEPYRQVQDPNPEARQALADLGRKAELEKRLAFLFVNNRLEGNSPETMLAVADLILNS
ncbi:MAG: DUF72 domain-containing protein [Bryobacterales bacterium]|jgi:uncharacterized protein YecE (DUF72 family)|nr:DUF72 domain-containing protein [Bryobacterales bacterium]